MTKSVDFSNNYLGNDEGAKPPHPPGIYMPVIVYHYGAFKETPNFPCLDFIWYTSRDGVDKICPIPVIFKNHF